MAYDALDDIDSEIAEGILEREELLRIRTQVDAEAFIKRYVNQENKEHIARIYFGFTHKRAREALRNQKGGDGTRGDRDGPLYELLAAADQAHDFGKASLSPVKMPKGLALGALIDKDRFMTFLKSRESVVFDAHANVAQTNVTNPCYGINLKGYDIARAIRHLKPKSIEPLYMSQLHSVAGKLLSKTRCVPVDVWSVPNTYTSDIKVSQIAHLCQCIRHVFGSSGRLEFQLDGARDQLVRLVFAIQLIDKGFHRLFTVEPDYATRIQRTMANGAGQEGSWSSRVSDAHLFDAETMPVGIPVDPRPTGPVLSFLELGGITDTGEVRITIDGKSAVVHPDDTTAQLSVAGISGFIRGRGTTSKNRKKKSAVGAMTLLDLYKDLSDASLYALKRAGDWGQVEHCVRYGKIFVTRDKLAALYAMYRSVPFIYVNHHVFDAFDAIPGFTQHTFVLGKGL